jgi:hypothetical protein
MGLMTGNFPPVDPESFMRKPYRERLRTLPADDRWLALLRSLRHDPDAPVAREGAIHEG